MNFHRTFTLRNQDFYMKGHFLTEGQFFSFQPSTVCSAVFRGNTLLTESRVLSTGEGGQGEVSPQTCQVPIPKVFLKKEAISNKDLFQRQF